MFLVARVLNGFGAGMIIANTPVYMSEISPAHTRGLLVSTQGMAITGAYIVSSLVAFGFHFVDAAFQWRLQFVVLTAITLILVVTMYFIPESPRWLMVSIDTKPRLDSCLTPPSRTTGKLTRRGRCSIGFILRRKTLLELWHAQNLSKSKHKSKRKRYSFMSVDDLALAHDSRIYHLVTGIS